MPARKKPTNQKPPVDDEQQSPDDQDQPNDDEEEESGEPEAPEPVRVFAATVRNHANTRKPFEPVRGVTLMYGYNGLLRVHGPVHVHVATADEVAEMSDQALYDAVMAAAARKKL